MWRVLTAALLVSTACAAQPPERSPLPDVEEVLPEVIGCQLSVGDPKGVSVVAVLSNTPAVGTLEEGDIITGISGVPTLTRPELAEVMTGYEPGDSIEITFLRNGDERAVSLTLDANPTDETRPMIGVTIDTAFDHISPDEADDIIEPSITARPIQVFNSLYLFDPLALTWQKTGVTPPADSLWVSTSTGLYSVTSEEPIRIIDLFTDGVIAGDGHQGWDLRRLIGSMRDDLLVVLTTEIPEQPGFVTVAIAAFDPMAGETIWISPISSTFGIPVEAHGSPDNSAFIAVGADVETGDQLATAIYDADGTQQSTLSPNDLGEPIGWFDDESVAFRTNEEIVSVFNLVDGSTVTYGVPQTLTGSAMAAVGDGQNVLAVDGRDLVLQDLTDPDVSLPLATNCSIGRTGDPGWGI